MNDYWKKPIGYTDINENRFSFVWKVDYMYKDIFTSSDLRSIKSSTFFDSCHQCHWFLQLCYKPKERINGYIIASSLFLSLNLDKRYNNTVDSTMHYYKFTILDGKSKFLYETESSCAFDDNLTKSVDYLYNPDELLKNFITDGTLIISCEIIKFQNQGYVKDNMIEFDRSQHLTQAYSKLELFFREKTLTNITLITKEENIEAHKVILALKSEIFRAMFENDIKEKKGNIVVIKGFSADVIKGMLSFMYTGKVKGIDKLAHDLLRCADKYSILGLKTLCAEFLDSTLSLDNVIDILLLADLRKCDALKNKISIFIATHKKDIIYKPQFKELKTSHPTLMTNIVYKILSNPQNSNMEECFSKSADGSNFQCNYFSFSWKIDHLTENSYSVIEITSPKFVDSIHECGWSLKLNVDHYSTTLSLTLHKYHKSTTEETEFFYEFIIVDEKFKILHKRRGSCVFKDGLSSIIPFIEGKKLFDSNNNFVTSGTLIICCNVSTVSSQDFEKANTCEFAKSNEQLDIHDNLELFLKEKILTDVTLITSEEKFEAHKVVLASKSPVFLAMFENDMKEKKESLVEIKDVSANVIKEMLSFVYYGKVESIDKLAHDLLICADKYSIMDLKKLCEQFISSTLCLENVIDTVLFADSYSCDLLKCKSGHFIATHKSITETPKFKELVTSNPAVLTDVLFEVLLQLDT